MRLSTAQLQAQSINSILEQQSKLGKTQLMLASGKRILTPADDPASAAQVVELTQSLKRNEQYQKNIELGRARLSLEEGSLNNLSNLLQRIRELAVQSNNASQGDGTRTDIAKEVRQRLDELLDLANSRDGNNEYLFAGYQGQTRPFSRSAGSFIYNGDQGQRFLQVSASRQIAVGDPGSELFLAVRNGNGNFSTSVNSANAGTGVVDVGAVIDVGSYNTGNNNSDTYSLIMANSSTANADGTALSFTDTGVNDALQYTVSINGTVVTTMNEGDSRTMVQLASDINTQVGTTGVRAYLDGGTIYLANETPGAGAISVTETLNGASELADEVVGLFGSELNGVDNTRTISVGVQSDAYLVLDSSSNIETSGVFQDGGQILFNGMQTGVKGDPYNGDRFALAPAANQDMFTTVQNFIDALETNTNTAAERSQIQTSLGRVLSELDLAMDNTTRMRAKVGARISAIDTQEQVAAVFSLHGQETLSKLQDLDYAKAVSDLNLQMVALESAQQSYVRIQGLSLFNYL